LATRSCSLKNDRDGAHSTVNRELETVNFHIKGSAMSQSMFLLFNHRITTLQKYDATDTLGVCRFLSLPDKLQNLWSQVPPDLPGISNYLVPICAWLEQNAAAGDYILIQGDFGACFLMVNFAFEHGLIPIYSTTDREAIEEHVGDGSVSLTHRFRHRIFRRYGY